MSLNVVQVEYIAELARLHLNPDEKERYSQQLSAILEYFARLQSVSTEHIAPTYSILPPRSGLRDDVTRPGLPQDELFKNAPEIDQQQFRLPAVFE